MQPVARVPDGIAREVAQGLHSPNTEINGVNNEPDAFQRICLWNVDGPHNDSLRLQARTF